MVILSKGLMSACRCCWHATQHQAMWQTISLQSSVKGERLVQLNQYQSMANDWGMQQIRLHSSTQTWKFQRQEPAPCTFPRHNQKVGRHMSSLCPHKTHSGKGYCSRSEDPIISSGGQETDSSCQKIWTMAWQALEPPQACNEKYAPETPLSALHCP